MPIHKLSARKVATVGPGKHVDGGGLRLHVSESRSRSWVLRYTHLGRQKDMGLGSYPMVDLAEARDLAVKYKRIARSGVDPKRVRDRELSEIRAVPTFTTVAAQFIRAKRREWSNSKHGRQWVSTLKTYARPVIGNLPVDEVSTDDVLKILTPIWTKKTETAKRVQNRIENIMAYAITRGYREAPNPATWRGHLNNALPNPAKVTKVKHHPAMPYDRVGSFMRELEGVRGMSALALRFLILNGLRTKPVREATWDQFDFEARAWNIPGPNMKNRKPFRVPLTDAALEILRSVPRQAGNPYVFAGAKPGRPLSENTLGKRVKDLGYIKGGEKGHYVPHGFRSSFRDWASELTEFSNEVNEMAMSHTIKNKAEAAYRRGQLFDKRRRLMEAWADYLK